MLGFAPARSSVNHVDSSGVLIKPFLLLPRLAFASHLSGAGSWQPPHQQLREHPPREQGQRQEPGHVEEEQRQIEAAGQENQQTGSQ